MKACEEHSVEKFLKKDAKKGCFNKQMGFQRSLLDYFADDIAHLGLDLNIAYDTLKVFISQGFFC